MLLLLLLLLLPLHTTTARITVIIRVEYSLEDKAGFSIGIKGRSALVLVLIATSSFDKVFKPKHRSVTNAGERGNLTISPFCCCASTRRLYSTTTRLSANGYCRLPRSSQRGRENWSAGCDGKFRCKDKNKMQKGKELAEFPYRGNTKSGIFADDRWRNE